ncbi:FitA-like ribbon-helix-helix domain-containing protein [Gordonia sp. (in: high G+C Gram-positive bacteria)]|uniref:FitA-like ribbon-helix-helix domain-containing protein n=1 Tax=Gordonia sp. (in: high G+C Gram-positive bacteria) TaxID=84139 RepID=UPI001D25A17E|nr:hypothetical protein [Gordonia sp. (in: high G+C Gram-positive bacteria)]MCB1294549.1 hypothetical protein [Gordonia sp. (in: high G+C Gram-positive bacteria)]HMS75435.1 hypothetical protein [Gordonia sp. (in: high G+C Gram-positive bacteria)]HQV19731.1 hypothetical protein [Gordonia sp. (in: high G+C Gram-positive bacteria)]
MTILTVRNLDPEIHQKLREQAAAHGRSMEAEARAILEAGVGPRTINLVEALRRFADDADLTEDEIDLMFPARRTEVQRPVTFDDAE